MGKRYIDVEMFKEIANATASLNQLRDLSALEFNYDGQIIEVTQEEIKQHELTGLSTMDFILNREWPDNPKYSE